MKKFIMNSIILLLFIAAIVLGIYVLNEYVIQNETVAEVFQQGYDNVTAISKNEDTNVEDPTNSITTSYNSNFSDNDNFYYNQLDDYAKIIYSKLNENKENMKSGNYTIEFGKTFNEFLNSENGEQKMNQAYQSALDAYLLDNPDVFYLDVTKMYLLMNTRTVRNKTTYTVTIGGENGESYYNLSFYSKQQIDSTIENIEQQADYIINNTSNNTYKKLQQMHDWLVDNVEYEQSLTGSNIRNIYGAFEEKQVVCEGYAKAYKYLLDKAGIENIIVVGYGTNSKGSTEDHAWNYVKLNGKWYAVDVTWDDPIIVGGGKLSDKNRYNYFLKGSNNFNGTHNATGKTSEGGIIFTYPELNVSDFN